MIKIFVNIFFFSLMLNGCNTDSVSKKKDEGTSEKGVKNFDFTKDGFVPDERTAIKVAEVILPPIYGEDILNQKPFSAKLIGDTVWYVDGSMYSNNKISGGVAHLEIRKKDCMILKVIHGK